MAPGQPTSLKPASSMKTSKRSLGLIPPLLLTHIFGTYPSPASSPMFHPCRLETSVFLMLDTASPSLSWSLATDWEVPGQGGHTVPRNATTAETCSWKVLWPLHKSLYSLSPAHFLEQIHEHLEPCGHLDFAYSPEQGNAPAWLLATEICKWGPSARADAHWHCLIFKSARTISIMTSFTVEIQLLQGSILLGWIFSAAATHGELVCRTTGSLMLVPAQGTSSMGLGTRGGDKACKAGRCTSATALGSLLFYHLCNSRSCVPAVSSPLLIPTISSCNPAGTARLEPPLYGLQGDFVPMPPLGPAGEMRAGPMGSAAALPRNPLNRVLTTLGTQFTPPLQQP